MQILGLFSLWVVFCSLFEFSKRVLQIFLGVLGMDCAHCFKILSRGYDFGCGFFMFARVSPVFNLLGLFLVLVLGLKVLQVGCHSRCLIEFICDFRGKASDLRNGFCSKCGFAEVCAPKPKSLENSHSPNENGLVLSKSIKAKAAAEEKDDDDDVDDDCDDGDDGSDDQSVCYNEDGEFDVLALRKLVKIERRKTNKAREELEKERMAAASAAEEAMAMILRLQNEKSCIEIQANQHRRMAEQKQQYDESVIQSLQWIMMKHESESCRQKLQHRIKVDKRDQSEEGYPSLSIFNSTMEDGMDDVLDVNPWERPHL